MKKKNRYIGVSAAMLSVLLCVQIAWGAYSFQTFSFQEVLTAAKMNQVEVNIRDHTHGTTGNSSGKWPGNIMIGSTTVDPDTLLHVYGGNAGSVSATTGSIETIESSGNGYLQFLSPKGAYFSGLAAGNPTDGAGDGSFLYDQNNRIWQLTSAGATTAKFVDSATYINNNVIIGGAFTVNPDTSLHVYGGSAGTVSSITGTFLTVENSGSDYLQFLSPKGSYFSGIVAGNPTDSNGDGSILYSQSARSWQVTAGGVQKVSVDSNGVLVSTLSTGTAPFSVVSTTKVNNLHADLLDGLNVSNGSGDIPWNNGTVNTNLNADMVDGLHAGGAVSGFVRGITTYVDSDGILDGPSPDLTSLSTSTWFSIGPTGSGADVVWSGLDNVPSGAKAVILRCLGTLQTTSAQDASLVLNMVSGDVSSPSNSSNNEVFNWYTYVGSTYTTYSLENNGIKVPLGSGRKMKFYYTGTGWYVNGLYLYLVGWVE